MKSEIPIVWAWLAVIVGLALAVIAVSSDQDQWQALLTNMGVGFMLGGGGVVAIRYLRRETVRAVRTESLTADAKRLARPTSSPNDQAGDTEPPLLLEFEIEPVATNVGTNDARVLLRARIVDNLSGVAGQDFTGSPTQVRFQSPSGAQFRDGLFESHVSLVEGDARDGHYETELVIPRYSETGVWRVTYFLLVDNVGNQEYLSQDDLHARGFWTTIEVGH